MLVKNNVLTIAHGNVPLIADPDVLMDAFLHAPDVLIFVVVAVQVNQ